MAPEKMVPEKIMDFRFFLFEETHSYSSVQIDLPSGLSKSIISWGKRLVPDREIYVKEGREDHIHLTVLYGIHTTSFERTYELTRNQKPFWVKIGKTSIFKNKEFDVLKLEVKSSEVINLNHVMRKQPYTTKHPKYIPHITIAYLKPGLGEKYKDLKEFSGREFKVNSVVFSSKNGKKTEIKFPT